MDKDQLDRLRADIRLTLQALNDNLLELSDYLTRLRVETIAKLEEWERERAATLAHPIMQVPADLFVATADEPTPDPRRPYQNMRQPRRDGDSFGSVLPANTGGIDHGTKTEESGE